MKRLCNKLRSRLTSDHLDQLMLIAMEGPEVPSREQIEDIVYTWYKAHPRKISSYLINSNRMRVSRVTLKCKISLNGFRDFGHSGLPLTFHISAKLNNFPTSNIITSIFHECGQLNIVSNHAGMLSCISNV